MTGPPVDDLDDDLVVRKLSYQVDRTLQLLECLVEREEEEAPFLTVVESYSRRKVESAAEQVVSGWLLSDGTRCSNCDAPLELNTQITVRARRPMGLLTWYLDACVCEECTLSLTPEADRVDVLASAVLTRWDAPDGTPAMMLHDVSVTDASGTQYRGSPGVEVTDDS